MYQDIQTNPYAKALFERVRQYALEAGFTEEEFENKPQAFYTLVQLAGLGASIEVNRVYQQTDLELCGPLIDASLKLDEAFLIGDMQSEQYRAYLEEPLVKLMKPSASQA